MAATTIQRALTCSPRAVAMIASAIVPRMPTRTQGPCVRRVVVMACSVPARFCFADDYALATEHRKAQGPSMPGLSHLAFCGLGEDGDQVGVIPSGALELTLD